MDQSIKFDNKLEFSEARFKAIMQTASDSIVIYNENSIIVFANKKTYEIFGHAEGTLIGYDLERLMPEKYRQGHRIGIQRFIAVGDPKLIGHTIEIEGLRKDGVIFPVELSLSSWKEGDNYFFSGIIRDNTEKKEASLIFQNQQEELAAANEELKAAEEELRTINDDLEHRVEIRTRELAESERKVKQSAEQLQLITDAVPALISYVRNDETYAFVNKNYEELFQLSREDIIDRPIKEVIGEKAYSTSLPLINKALRGEFVESEILQDYGPKVGKKWRRASFVPHQVEGKIIGTYVLVEDITKLKNILLEQELANQKLREKDEFYQALIEHGSDFITVFDEKLNYLYCGGAIFRELGYEAEQLIGDNALNFVHPDDVPNVKESLSKALASQEPIKIPELRFKNAKGEWRWLEATLSNQFHNPAVKSLVVSSRDITEGVHNRLKLQESKQRFKSLFDNHLDIVLFQNKEGVILDANAAALSFFGVQKQDVLNQPFSNFLPPDIIPICEQTLQNALKGESVRFEIAIPFEGKGSFTFDIAKVPVEVNGETIGVYSVLRDVTARKEVEENQLQMTNDLFRQNRDLQQFTYIVSHNLRSPIASIMGLADLLIDTDKSSATYNVSLDYLKRTANQLDTVMRDLNQILSIRNKKDYSGKEKVELAPVCQQVITTLQDSLYECGGKVLMEMEECISVNGNKAYLYSILYNLLSNSIKYRSPNRPLEVKIKCNSLDNGVDISFSDNGLGFDMNKVGDHIFKLYKRFHTNFEGRGIGLFLVKTHVETMDGHIKVDSNPDAGTTFLIYLN